MAVVEVEAIQVGVERGNGRLALQEIGAGFAEAGVGGGLDQRGTGEQQQGGEPERSHGAFSQGLAGLEG